MRGAYLPDALEQGVGCGNRPIRQVRVEAAVVDLRRRTDCQQSLDLRGERDPARYVAIVERADAEAVAHQVGGVRAHVVRGESELAVEPLHEADALQGESRQDDLGVAAAAERVVQLGAKVLVVDDPPVEHQHPTAVGRVQGWCSPGPAACCVRARPTSSPTQTSKPSGPRWCSRCAMRCRASVAKVPAANVRMPPMPSPCHSSPPLTRPVSNPCGWPCRPRPAVRTPRAC